MKTIKSYVVEIGYQLFIFTFRIRNMFCGHWFSPINECYKCGVSSKTSKVVNVCKYTMLVLAFVMYIYATTTMRSNEQDVKIDFSPIKQLTLKK